MSQADAIHILPRNTTWRRKVTMMAWLGRLRAAVTATPTQRDPPLDPRDAAFRTSVMVFAGYRVFTDGDLGGDFGIHALMDIVTAPDLSFATWLQLVQMVYLSHSEILSAHAQRDDKYATFPWAQRTRLSEVRQYWRAVLYTTYMRTFSKGDDATIGRQIADDMFTQETSAQWTHAPPSDPSAQPLFTTLEQIATGPTPYSPHMVVMGHVVEMMVMQATDRAPLDDNIFVGLIPKNVLAILRTPSKLEKMRMSIGQTRDLNTLVNEFSKEMNTQPGVFWEKEPYAKEWYAYLEEFREDARNSVGDWAKEHAVPAIVAEVFDKVWADMPYTPGTRSGEDRSPLQVITDAVNNSELSTLDGVKNPYQIQPETDYVSQELARHYETMEVAARVNFKIPWFKSAHVVGNTDWPAIFARVAEIINDSTKSRIRAQIHDDDSSTFVPAFASQHTIHIVRATRGNFYEWGVWYKSDRRARPIWSVPSPFGGKPPHPVADTDGGDGFDASNLIHRRQKHERNNPLITVWTVLMIAAGFTRVQISKISALVDMIGGEYYMAIYLRTDFAAQHKDIFALQPPS